MKRKNRNRLIVYSLLCVMSLLFMSNGGCGEDFTIQTYRVTFENQSGDTIYYAAFNYFPSNKPEDSHYDLQESDIVHVLKNGEQDEFIEAIERPFDYVSSKYKIDLTVRFADMGGYTAEELDQILRMNLDLRIKGLLNDSRAQTKLANSLIVIGILSFLIMILISNHWTTESIWKDIFFYIADISTTVAFWEALTMLVVEKEEKRTHLRNLKNRFVSIRLIQDDAEQEQEQSL